MIELRRHEYFPGLWPKTYDVQANAGRVPKSRSGSPCAAPLGIVWLTDLAVTSLLSGRVQAGLETLMLQGGCLAHLHFVTPGLYFSSFLQVLAGHALSLTQFGVFYIAGLLTA